MEFGFDFSFEFSSNALGSTALTLKPKKGHNDKIPALSPGQAIFSLVRFMGKSPHITSRFDSSDNSEEIILPPLTAEAIKLPDPQATLKTGRALGQAIGGKAHPPFLVTLEGPLGAGKTTLCQGLAEALGVKASEVVSPTFTLANVYSANGKVNQNSIDNFKTINHLDLYRLGQRAPQEFLEAGLEECLDGLCLIEWPERLPRNFWPDERLELLFNYHSLGRTLRARQTTPRAQEIWAKAAEVMGDLVQRKWQE
jgi:tRNA threonylcarbamoyladenosine biosynthesis protein TsaE